MLVTPHLLAGAAIGKTGGRAWLVVPAAFLSHFLLDIVPHLDTHGMFGVPGGPVTRPEAIAGTVDTLFGAALVLWLARRQPYRRLILWCAFAAAAIDLFYNVPPWGRWLAAWPGTNWLGVFHHSIQNSLTRSQWALGLSTQLVVASLAVWVMMRGGAPRDRDVPAARGINPSDSAL